MGLALPQVVTEDRASGAQVIDGSLKFDDNYLTRTPSSEGNLKSWTWSAWIKPDRVSGNLQQLFEAKSGGSDYDAIYFTSGQALSYDLYRSSQQALKTTNRVFRDTGWYHIVVVYDAENSTADDRVRIYVNGERETSFSSSTNPDTTDNSFINDNGVVHQIGDGQAGSQEYDGRLSQVYLIDGQALDASYFGFTDPLTNTWRPKKFSGSFTQSAINDGTVWSDSTESMAAYQGPAGIFDGVLGTDNRGGFSSTNTSQYYTLFDRNGVNLNVSVTKIRIYWNGVDSGQRSVRINDSTEVNGGSGALTPGWDTYTYSGTLHKLEVKTAATSSWGISAVEINDVILIDGANNTGVNSFYLPLDGNSPIGHDKSNPNPINNATVWSSGAGANFEVANPASNGFDGSSSTYTRTDNANVTATVTLPSSVPFTTLQVRGARDSGNGTITVNGVNVSSQFTSSSATLETVTITGVTSPLTSIALTGISGAAQPRFAQIIVDGVVLIDNMYGNGWTPVNFGGSNSLEKATGALPILNTTQGGTQGGVGVFGSKEGFFETVSSSSGGGNPYIFDGRGTQPTLSFIRGATYVFDYSSATSHPLRFATAADAAGSTQYTTGTSVSGNVISFTVPHNAPATLYYYCTNHGGMGNSISVTTDETKADKYASNLVVAMPLVGITTDVSNLVNSGTTAKSVSQTGSASDIAVSSEQSNFYASSAKFQGNVSRLEISGGGGTDGDYDFGTGDFTMECWFYATATVNTNNRLFCSRGDRENYQLMIGSNKYLEFDISGTAYKSANNVFGLNKWHHFAATRQSGTLRLFVDGVIVKEQSSVTTDLDETTGIDIGYETGYSSYINGYMQDARVYKGVAKYTSNFIPASTSPDILPDTPSGVSGGSKLTKITDGAVAFDGTGDYLTLAQSNDFDLTGDYTYEAFIYYTDTSGNPTIFDFSAASSNYEGRLQIQAGVLNIYDGGWQSRGALTANAWHHIAVTQAKVYVDGIDVGASSGAVSGSNYKKPTIGARTNNGGTSYGDYFTGQISNVRIVNGTALYTSNFTPPTAPLTNVTNTKLLCCQSSSSAIVAAVNPPTETWQPSGFTYWTAGMSQNWNQSGSSTSASGDYINVALPTSGKYYWESTLNNPSEFRVFGIQQGADFVAGSYNNTFGFYFNGNVGDPTAVFLTKNESGTSRGDAISHGSSAGAAFSNGEKIMWAWDADNDKIWLGRDGTWYASGDPATGANASISSEDLSAASWYYKIGYNNEAGATNTLTLTNVTSTSSTNFDPVANGDAAATNFNPFITDIKTVRGQETGYCTLNPLFPNPNGNTLTDGNLKQTTTSGNGGYRATTLIPETGSWYWEVTKEGADSTGIIGIAEETVGPGSNVNGTGSYSWYIAGPRKQTNGVDANYGGSVAQGDIVGVAYNADIRELRFYLNGVDQGVAFGPSTSPTISEGRYFPGFSAGSSSNTFSYSVNFGQKPFKFPPPAGFQPLNTANTRPETVITRPDQYVGATIYTGNGGTKSISVGHKPDFVWIKNRDASVSHYLHDTVRGSFAYINSNGTSEQNTNSGADWFSSFDSNGFTVKYASTGFGNSAGWNENSTDYVAWSWKAGGSKNTFNVDDVGYASAAASGLSCTADLVKASVGTKQGFSIIQYQATSGETVAHGLSKQPSFMVIKNIDSSGDWFVYHKNGNGSGGDMSGSQGLNLNNADGTFTSGSNTFVTAKSATTFTVGSSALVQNGSDDMIAYIWHDVPGLQKFGHYSGNQNANGPFIELGFRPAIVWVKGVGSGSTSWRIFDKERSPFNTTTTLYLRPNVSNGDLDDTRPIDIVSNGFKIRVAGGGDINLSSGAYEYIYCAWAEAPTVNLYGGQSNAR